MAATERLVHFTGGHEGKVLTAYLDPVHKLTIGYGATDASAVFNQWWAEHRGGKLKRGDTITEAEANEILRRMLDEEYAPPVLRGIPFQPLNVQEPAVSMNFNCGPKSLTWKWFQNLRAGNLKLGCQQWRVTGTTAKGKKLPGLVRRRKEEADIAEFNSWPQWLVDKWPGIDAAPDKAPDTYVDHADIRQAQQWLNQLGYPCGEVDGIVGKRTQQAAARFQKDHGTLRVDGIIGPATLSALQRAIDLKSKATKVAVPSATAATAGAADQATGTMDSLPDAGPIDTGWLGDLLLWGGLAVLVIGLGYLAWRYRDELNAFLRKL